MLKKKVSAPIIAALPLDEETLNHSLILVGLFPQNFCEVEAEIRSAPQTPRVKRSKKKEHGLKQINTLLQRREDNKEKEKLSPDYSPETMKKKPKVGTPNTKPKLRLYGPCDIPGAVEEEVEDELFSFGSTSEEDQVEQTPIITETPKADLDLHLALSLQFDSEHVSHKLSKSTEIKNPTAWPSLQNTPKPAALITPSSPVSWPSLSPAASPQPKPAWGPKPASTAWGSQNLAQKLQALKTEK